MRKDGVSTLKVAATYIGTIVGAGFATGQEVLQFFATFGVNGFAGVVLATLMFIFFGNIIMELGRKLNARSHLEIITFSSGNVVGSIIDFIITVFLFGAFSAMIAGTGALFLQQFNLPGIVGAITMALLTAITVITGITGVINSISFVVPFLLVAVIVTSVFSILDTPPDFYAIATIEDGSGLISNWILAAILYVSYNTVIAVAVLGPLGVKARDSRSIKNGAILGGLGLGLGSVMIYLALAGNIGNVVHLEVPMIFIAGQISSVMLIIYAMILIAAIYTTAVASLYGFVSRVTSVGQSPRKGRFVVVGISVAALIASQFGFSNIVKYLYPAVGFGGILLLVSLLYTRLTMDRP